MRRVVPAHLLTATVTAALVVAGTAAPSHASRPGDATRYDTWVGYDIDRFPTAVVSSDLDSDGRPDAAWARDDFFDNSMTVTLNLGDGTLGSTRAYETGAQSTDIAAADLDGDGDNDLAVSSRGNGFTNNVVDLYLNQGTGVFTHTTTAGGHAPEGITAGDVDGDGDADLVLANYWGEAGTISVLRNDGDATFAAEQQTEVGQRVHDTVIGNFQGGGAVEIAAVVPDAETNGYAIHVLAPGPGGAFAPDDDPQPFDMQTNGGSSTGSPSLTAGDLDDDGDLDLAASGTASFEHVVLLNEGAGAFTSQAYESFVMQLRAFDIDGDDDLDLVGVGGGGGIRGTAVWCSTTTVTAPSVRSRIS